jgi:hypothetical protein
MTLFLGMAIWKPTCWGWQLSWQTEKSFARVPSTCSLSLTHTHIYILSTFYRRICVKHRSHLLSRARKSSAGYDLTRLLIGSEGTLAVMTEVELRLHGVPDAQRIAVCSFPSIQEAVDTCTSIMQMGIPVARMELMDHHAMAATNAYSKLNNLVAPSLVIELHGSTDDMTHHATSVRMRISYIHDNPPIMIMMMIMMMDRKRSDHGFYRYREASSLVITCRLSTCWTTALNTQ